MQHLFDIDDTLYRSNTTYDFVRRVVSQGPSSGKIRHGLFLSRWSPFFYVLVILNKLTGGDRHKSIAVGMLKGYSAEQLESMAADFYDNFLASRKNAPVFARFDREQSTGKVLLVSSTIEPVAKVIADRLNVFYLATTLQFEGAVCKGKILKEISGRKLEAFKTSTYFQGESFSVTTDNNSDRELLRYAHDRFVVINRRKDRAAWSGFEATFINCYE